MCFQRNAKYLKVTAILSFKENLPSENYKINNQEKQRYLPVCLCRCYIPRLWMLLLPPCLESSCLSVEQVALLE